jgi:L-threonylcarbamoyladenylate synthase
VHVVDARAAEALAAEWPRHAVVLAEHFWPGPLTMVVRRGETVAAEVAAGGATVAVRVPAHPVALALIASAGAPIAAPSANRSSRVSPTTAAHVLRDLRDRIDMVLDGGSTPIGIESTVLDLTTDPPALLRPGRITPSELSAYIGEVRVAGRAAGGATSLRSPGMLERHYAPAAPVRLAAPPGDDVVRDLLQAGDRVGWLRLGRSSLAHERLTAIAMPEDARAYAAMLYAALHRLEDAGVEKIVVSAPPETENWSAVRDRLSRAATPGITR